MKAIIFGAGFSGSVCARVLAEKGWTVELFERNAHIGGNAYDYSEANILVHKYGPHIFHTNDERAFEFLSRFTEWVPYEHKVLGQIDGQLVPIPFNMQSLALLYSKQQADYIAGRLKSEYGEGNKVPILKLRAHTDKTIAEFGEYVYQKVFYNYTVKQWGFTPDKLPESVTARVPVSISDDDRYFTDTYQCMPKDGFTKLFERLLTHPNITLSRSCEKKLTFEDGRIVVDGKYTAADDVIVFTGCLDELLDNRFGRLPYRSLRFEFETHEQKSYQPAAVVNYPNTEKFTRISEFTKFTCVPQEKTILVKEYPQPHEQGKTIPYYPIERAENRSLYEKYAEFFKNYPRFYPLGRLAEYQYINMDKAAANALCLAEKLTK